jgi:hypothetical protein
MTAPVTIDSIASDELAANQMKVRSSHRDTNAADCLAQEFGAILSAKPPRRVRIQQTLGLASSKINASISPVR